MRFFIKSYGCQMNTYDSQRIADLLIASGHESSEEAADADIIIFNTCSIREKADEKLFSDLGRARMLQEQRARNEASMIIVAGCVAQAQAADAFAKRFPYINAVVGPQNIHEISGIVDRFFAKTADSDKSFVAHTELDARRKFSQLTRDFHNRSFSEFLTIQEGCDNFCTYCVVPYTRGREVSRDVSDVISEAKKLLSLGVKEITLLGQNVNSYRGVGVDGKTWSLSRLLFKLAELDGLKRLRYVTSNPKDISTDIAAAHRDIAILMPFLHLPVQSGSDKILQKMNRKYVSSEYMRCIDMLREHCEDISFSSDFIVGFPGETDDDFEATLKLAENVQFSQAYSFKYSPRNKTVAAKMIDQVPESIKSERLAILQNMLNDQQSKFNESSIGKRMSLLLVKNGKHENQLVGRSEYSQAVSVYGKDINIGDIVNVRIIEALSHSLAAIVEK